ncbi:CLC_0170 family protein [Clostridium muellerianum]|uniref:CLC_0170 family protein n=1 Tax=Clostridium muellerianum TaxID=2716538 RepID=UPI003CC93E19
MVRIIKIFNLYFLILMIIQGLVLAFFDSKSFDRKNLRDTGKKAKIMGIGFIIISISLYLVSTFTI